MSKSKALALVPTFAAPLAEVAENRAQLESYAKDQLKKGVDWYEIGNSKSLSKSGAEKLLHIYGLFSRCIVIDKIERWTSGPEGLAFFRYLYRCEIMWPRNHEDGHTEEIIVATCDGEANSQETKFGYRWLSGDQMSEEQKIQCKAQGWKTETRPKLVPFFTLDDAEKAACRQDNWASEKKESKKGNMNEWVMNPGVVQFRAPNDNPADLVNTLIKMAQKRAFVGASIIAVKASDLFTQDLEDMDPNLYKTQPKAAEVVTAEVVPIKAAPEAGSVASDKPAPAQPASSIKTATVVKKTPTAKRRGLNQKLNGLSKQMGDNFKLKDYINNLLSKSISVSTDMTDTEMEKVIKAMADSLESGDNSGPPEEEPMAEQAPEPTPEPAEETPVEAPAEPVTPSTQDPEAEWRMASDEAIAKVSSYKEDIGSKSLDEVLKAVGYTKPIEEFSEKDAIELGPKIEKIVGDILKIRPSEDGDGNAIEGHQWGKCNKCDGEIYWMTIDVRGEKKKRPFNLDHVVHFETCSSRQSGSKAKVAKPKAAAKPKSKMEECSKCNKKTVQEARANMYRNINKPPVCNSCVQQEAPPVDNDEDVQL